MRWIQISKFRNQTWERFSSSVFVHLAMISIQFKIGILNSKLHAWNWRSIFFRIADFSISSFQRTHCLGNSFRSLRSKLSSESNKWPPVIIYIIRVNITTRSLSTGMMIQSLTLQLSCLYIEKCNSLIGVFYFRVQTCRTIERNRETSTENASHDGSRMESDRNSNESWLDSLHGS